MAKKQAKTTSHDSGEPKSVSAVTDNTMRQTIQRQRREAEIRERLIFERHELLKDGKELPQDKLQFLKAGGPPTSATDHPYRRQKIVEGFLRREDTRAGRIVKLQSICGTPADLEVHQKKLKEMSERLAKEGPECQRQIDELTARLNKLQANADEAQSAVDQRVEAKASLCDPRLSPCFRQDELASLQRRWNEDAGHRLETKRTRLSVLESLRCLDVTPQYRKDFGATVGGEGLETVKKYIESLVAFGETEQERLSGFYKTETIQNGPHKYFRCHPDNLDRDAWKKYLSGEVAAEIEQLREQIAELEADEAKVNEELEALRSFYVPS